MDFYTSIAPYYDAIFPLDPEALQWVLGYLSSRQGPRVRETAGIDPGTTLLREPTANVSENHLLDIGCATGHLAQALAARGHDVVGIDLDPALIARARDLLQLRKLKLRFEERDMRRVGEFFPQASFDLVTCFGNTLVHLQDLTEIAAFCQAVRNLLRPGGVFLGQIINYDRILRLRPPGLPTVDNKLVKFQRNYDYPPGDSRILFETHLTDKVGGSVIHNRISLYPVTRADLSGALEAAGFARVDLFADLEGTAWSPSAYALFFAAVLPPPVDPTRS